MLISKDNAKITLMGIQGLYRTGHQNIESSSSRVAASKFGAVLGLSGVAMSALMGLAIVPLAEARLEASLNGDASSIYQDSGINVFLAEQTPACAQALIDPSYGTLLNERAAGILKSEACGTDKKEVDKKVVNMIGKTVLVEKNAEDLAQQRTWELASETAVVVGALTIAGAAVRRRPAYARAAAAQKKAEKRAESKKNWQAYIQQTTIDLKYSLHYRKACKRHVPKRFAHKAITLDTAADN